MNEDFGPGGVFPKNERPVNRFARNPPLKLKPLTQNLDLSGSYRETNLLYLKREIQMNRVLNPMWVKCEVEDQPCWAIVDTGARTSSISRHMASLVGKPVNPHQHRLLGPIGNVMPIDGKMLAEVTFGKHKSTDEFFVVDELYPHVLIGFKFLCDNKCQVDMENETLKSRIRDQAETTAHFT